VKVPVEFEALGELPSGWRWQQLQDLAADPRQDIVDGPFGSNLKASEYVDEGVPIARLQNVDRNQFIDKNIRCVTEAKAAELERHRFQPGDILLTKLGDPLGKACIVPPAIGGGVIVADLVRIRPDLRRVDRKYLTYALNSPAVIRQLERHTKGTTRPRVNLSVVRELPIPVAPRDEQKSVVAEVEKQFSRLDEAVANLKRVKANLKRQRSSVLQAVTSGRLAAEGSVPRQEKWRWLTIEELASAAPRSIQSGPFGSNLKHSDFQLSGKLVIGIDNVRDGEFSIGSNHRISEAKFKELEKYAARPGDVLITVMATIGRVCVVPDDIEPAIITKHVYRITVNRDLAIPAYVGIALRGSGEVREQLMDLVQGQTRPGLNGGLIKKIRLPIPPLAYQWSVVAEVDRRLSIVREVEAEVDANLKRAQALRQAVLAQAFLSDSLGTRREAAARI